MSEVLKTIYERRAVRKYKDQTVDRELLNQILQAGRMAPSAMNKQPWKFYILTNREMIREFAKSISKVVMKQALKMGLKDLIKSAAGLLHFPIKLDFLKENDKIFHGAPVVIFITAPEDNEWASLDIGMCAQNMMLAAKSLGLESCPVGLGKFVEDTKLFPQLHISKSEKVMLSVIFGYGDETPERHKRIRNNATFL